MPFGPQRTGKHSIYVYQNCFKKKFKHKSGIYFFRFFSTYVRSRSTGAIFAFGLNNYFQLGVKEKDQTIFTPKLTSFENVKAITGKFLFVVNMFLD